jgi:hypothetical protein
MYDPGLDTRIFFRLSFARADLLRATGVEADRYHWHLGRTDPLLLDHHHHSHGIQRHPKIDILVILRMRQLSKGPLRPSTKERWSS